MSSTAVAIAEAVKVAVNGAASGTFNQPVAAIRRAALRREVKATRGLVVAAIPSGLVIEDATREEQERDWRILLATQKAVTFDGDEDVDNSSTDPLYELVEQFETYLTGRDLTLADGRIAEWRESSADPLRIPDHLFNLNQFTSVLAFTYRVYEP